MTAVLRALAPMHFRTSKVRRLVERIRRARADARARRALSALDRRTLRDIGLSRQDVVFFSFERHHR